MPMMSGHHEMMGQMLGTMEEMARMLKEEAKDPGAKAKADTMLANIHKMRSQHQQMGGMMGGQRK